jgi:error-prone DNA polymerase
LLSLGKKRGGKARCRLDWSDLVAYGEGLIAVLAPDEADDICAMRLRRLAEGFGDRAYMALTLRRRPNDALRLYELSNMALQARVPTVVTNDVLFHVPTRRVLQDVVTCIRHNCTIDEAGFRRERHADRYLKPPEEMARLFSRYPEALARTLEIASWPINIRRSGPCRAARRSRRSNFSPGKARLRVIPRVCRTR